MYSQILNFITNIFKDVFPDKISFTVYISMFILFLLLFKYFLSIQNKIKDTEIIELRDKIKYYTKAISDISQYISNDNYINKEKVLISLSDILPYTDKKLSYTIIKFISSPQYNENFELIILLEKLKFKVDSMKNYQSDNYFPNDLIIFSLLRKLGIGIVFKSLLCSFVSLIIILLFSLFILFDYASKCSSYQIGIHIISIVSLIITFYIFSSIFFKEKLSTYNKKNISLYIFFSSMFLLIVIIHCLFKDINLKIFINFLGILFFVLIMYMFFRKNNVEI